MTAPDPDRTRTAGEPASPEHPRSPLLAALGAGDVAVAAVARAVADALGAATTTQKTVQQRVAELPAELDGLRARFPGGDLRRAVEAYRTQVERAYAGFAGRGEEAWGRLRERPEVRQAITTLEAYTEMLDARVDGLVDEAQDAAARALAVAGRQTRVTGEKVAQASGTAADAVVDATAATADAVEEAGTATAERIEEAGGETAAAARKATRRTTTPRRAPRPGAPKSGPTPDPTTDPTPGPILGPTTG